MTDERNPLERPFITQEQLEAMNPDLMQHIKEQFPGMNIVCAGDAAELPEGLAESVAQFNQSMLDSLMTGKCVDCKTQMPNFPESPDGMDENWKPAEGWKYFSDHEGDIQAWQCPACDAAEGDGPTFVPINPEEKQSDE